MSEAQDASDESVAAAGENLRGAADAGGIRIARVDWFDPRAAAIRDAMDAEMDAVYAGTDERVGPEVFQRLVSSLTVHPEQMLVTIVALDGDAVVGHAALRPAAGTVDGALEVKRVIVASSHRGRGIARRLMTQLEVIAREHGAPALVLQTGDRQPAAVALYEAIGYRSIPLFGAYEGIPVFLTYQKDL